MLRYLLLALSLSVFLIGCPTGGGSLDDDDATGDDDDDITPPTDDDDAAGDDDDAADDDDTTPEIASIAAVHPEDGTLDHFVGEDLWVDFDIEPEEAEVTLADDAGTPVEGENRWLFGTRLAFDPDLNLAHGGTYTATVTWPGKAKDQTHSWTFTTSTLGDTPVEVTLVGNTYAYDLSESTVVAPTGGDALLEQFNATFLQGVTVHTDTEIAFIGALAAAESDPPVQDVCSQSVDLNEKQPAVWVDPYFLAGPADLDQTLSLPDPVGTVDITFRDVEVSGLFNSSLGDGVVDQILEGTFSAVVDVRDAGFGDACDLLKNFVAGLTCVTCPHDPASDQCVIFDLIDLEASLVDGLELITVTQEDIDANPACE